ncbi:hypothetical protein HK101_009054 [Irineochytrium annulatum]|nr:hypothetical protein HK101_009054 [Irineochytrium annulatum]
MIFKFEQQQVAVVDKFLAQASDLSLDPDSNEASVSIEPSEINDMPALTDRLDAFIRSYKRQTEKFKLECLANGRIHGTVNSWTPQSATSSRNSSRPGSASTTAGRTPLARAASIGRQMISDDDVSEGSSTSDPSERAPSEDSSTNTSQGHGSYGSSGLRTPERFPMRPVTVVTSANPFLDGGGSAGSTQGRRWASPALASPSLGSAFPVSYAWSAAHGGKRAKSGPLAASMAPPGAAKGAKTKQQSFLAIKGKSVYK